MHLSSIFCPAEESQIAAAGALRFGYENVQAVAAKTPKRQEYWRLLLFLGLIVLVAEWTIFSKRVFV